MFFFWTWNQRQSSLGLPFGFFTNIYGLSMTYSRKGKKDSILLKQHNVFNRKRETWTQIFPFFIAFTGNRKLVLWLWVCVLWRSRTYPSLNVKTNTIQIITNTGAKFHAWGIGNSVCYSWKNLTSPSIRQASTWYY